MPGYYASCQAAYAHIEQLISKERGHVKEVDISRIVYHVTRHHQVGEKLIRKRVELMSKVFGDFEVVGDKIVFK